VVGISVGVTDYCRFFCLADDLAGTPFLNNLAGTPVKYALVGEQIGGSNVY
jgi:hypothetical protein